MSIAQSSARQQSGHHGGGQDHGQNHPAPPQVQPPQKDRYLVKGATDCYNRLEINDFIKDEKFFSLYIQALDVVYTKSQDNVESYFQIGGIHGRPYHEFADAKGTDNTGRWAGYCTHSTVLFPTWHRPYVMLLEQVIQKRAIEIAGTYTVHRDEWKRAAVSLRQPYWDWAVHGSPPPEVISMKQVTITNSQGKKTLVNNPLYSYLFPQGTVATFEVANFATWPTTLRCPTSTNVNATSDTKSLQSNLDSDAANVRKATYNMLSQLFQWQDFATLKITTSPVGNNSLEAVHDGIHYKIGGTGDAIKGHMGTNDFAAFDPIFFLHHSNVDRLISLWSALNPGVWVTAGDSAEGTATIPKDSPIDAKTQLAPFWNSNTTFWTSAELQNTVKLGYSYPEFDGLNLGNPQAVRTAIARKVNTLYGAAPTHRTPAPGMPAPPSDGSCPDLGAWDWTARVQIKKYDVGTSFVVVFFFGEVRHFVMVNASPENCANCKGQSDIVVQGFVHLNIALDKYLGSLEPEKVAQYLKNNLQWRVQKNDGTPVTPESLEVVVFATPLSYPEGTLFPVPGKPRRYDSCTRGRPGGSRQTGNF